MEQLVREAARLGIAITEAQAQQYARYQALLLAWNAHVNLTAIREPALMQTKHFLDSLTCVTVMGKLDGMTLLDVGTGAGFPGLPLKILFPELRVTLVESVVKKTRFLQAVVAELGLTQVQVVAERAESLGQQSAYREQYDWVVARAVAELRVLLEYLLPFCRVGGRVLAQKGEGVFAETAVADHALHILGGGRPQVHEVVLAGDVGPRYLVVVPKIAPTPAQYPRRPGMPAKRPLS